MPKNCASSVILLNPVTCFTVNIFNAYCIGEEDEVQEVRHLDYIKLSIYLLTIAIATVAFSSYLVYYPI